jgi:Fimbrial assembly protein (PilN)
MGGKVERGQISLVRCLDDDWELWSFPASKRAQFVRHLGSPKQAGGETIVALPLRYTVSYATWVPTVEKEVVPEIVQLQLEKRGLVQRQNAPSTLDVRVLESKEDKSLALATVLLPELGPELAFEKAKRFEPIPFTLPLPQDRLILWRERQRLAITVTRGRDPIHFQVLSTEEVSDEVINEVRCVLLQLESQRLLHDLLGLAVWGDFTDDEIDRLQKGLSLKVFRESVPPPNLPATASNLLPPEVAVLHEKAKRRRRIQRLIAAAAGIYLFCILGIIGYIFWQQSRIAQLQNQISAELPTVKAIQNTADQWKKVEWAVDPKLYAVELLHQVASLLPPQGMRLTAFQIEKGKVIIRGEASTAAAAFKLHQNIKQSPGLKLFQWDMKSPSLRPDGRAEFIIEGEPTGAKVD